MEAFATHIHTALYGCVFVGEGWGGGSGVSLCARTHTVHWPLLQKGRRELCYSQARLSHQHRGTPERKNIGGPYAAEDQSIGEK